MKILRIKRFFKRIIGDRWEVRRCLWTYQEGYATYNPYRETILDSGLSKEQAQKICDNLNSEGQ